MTYIIDGVQGMGLAPLCEGVESAEQLAFLREIGCERAQGYFFGKPMPLWESRAFARNRGMKIETVAPQLDR